MARKSQNGIFQFKQFAIHHSRSAMKVGTDGVLLGAWADVSQATRILDAGTGSGLIAIMLAQRTNDSTYIDAVEVDTAAATEAMENVSRSPWMARISVYHDTFQQYAEKCSTTYDLIVSNPPYFTHGTHSPVKQRHNARHTLTLPYEDIISGAKNLLSPQGRLSLILPAIEGADFITQAREKDLYLIRRTSFRPRHTKPTERLLLEFSKQSLALTSTELVHYNEDGEWTCAYKNLTKPFYLRL